MSVAKRSPACGVIFDMDGTLIEPAIDFAALRAALGIPQGDLLHTIRAWPPPQQAWASQVIERFEAQAASQMRLRAGASELLAALRARRIPTAIITRNARPRVDQLIALLDDHPFWPILDRSFWPPKPDPASLLHVVERWGGQPSGSFWMIGDSSHDLDAARAAGVMDALIAHEDNLAERAQASLVVHCHTELIPWLVGS